METQWSNYRPQPIRIELIRALAKAAPPDTSKEIRDTQTPGLILRHEKSGSLLFYVQLGRGKRTRPWDKRCDARQVIDPQSPLTLSAVKDEALRLLGRKIAGEDVVAQRRAKRAVPTLREYLDDTYGPWVKQNRRSGEQTLARIEACFGEQFGAVQISELTPAALEPWRARRKEGKPTRAQAKRTNGKQRKARTVREETINRDISALRAALARAVKLKIIDENPLEGVETEETDRHRRVVRGLTADERSSLLAALRARDDEKREGRARANKWREERGYDLMPPIGTFADVLTPAVIVSLETGLRRSELFALEWPYVDLEHRELRVVGATAKTYETRDVPLSSLAHKTLRDWWLQCGQPKAGYVFSADGGRLGSLKKSYHAVLDKAGIERVNAKGERVNWHSLRHTFGSMLAAAGVDPKTIMELMGHANLATTQRYLHTDKKRKRAAVEQLGGQQHG